MKFLADEHFPMASVRLLVAAGHDVVHAAHVARGEDDLDLLVICESEGRTMLTFDKDFGDLAFRDDRYPSTGVVLFRLRTRSIEEPARLLLQELITAAVDPLRGRITVITERGARYRDFE